MKRFLCGVLAALMLVVLCACGKQETTTVRLSEVTHSVFYAPQYVALEQGFFTDEGLNIELTNGGGADKVMTAVLTGQADIGLAGPEACIYVYNQGKDDHPVVFGQLTKRDGSFLVGREDVPFSWELLRGRTVIGGRAGGVPEMTLEYVMRQNGVVPGTDAAVDTTVQFNMMAGAFTGGNGDFVTLFEPTATEVYSRVHRPGERRDPVHGLLRLAGVHKRPCGHRAALHQRHCPRAEMDRGARRGGDRRDHRPAVSGHERARAHAGRAALQGHRRLEHHAGHDAAVP